MKSGWAFRPARTDSTADEISPVLQPGTQTRRAASSASATTFPHAAIPSMSADDLIAIDIDRRVASFNSIRDGTERIMMVSFGGVVSGESIQSGGQPRRLLIFEPPLPSPERKPA